MTERPSSNPEQRPIHLGEGCPIVEPFESQRFRSQLEQLGFRTVEESEVLSDHKLTVEIPAGRFRLNLGFPEIDTSDRRYFYGNLPKHLQTRSLELDTDDPRFVAFADELRRRSPSTQHLTDQITAVRQLMQTNFKPTCVDENIRRLSDILQNRTSACAGLTLVAGLLYRSAFSTGIAHVQRVSGASTQFGDIRPHEIGHEWLRVSNGRESVLYDPYYDRLQTYDLTAFVPRPDDPFTKYEVQADGIGVLNSTCQLKSVANVRIVQSVQGKSEVWYNQTAAPYAQAAGTLSYEFSTNGGSATFVNGGFQHSRSSEPEAARYITPLYELEKIT